jgi:hypothetical protein
VYFNVSSFNQQSNNEGMIKKIRQVGEHRCFLNLLLNFKSLQLPCSRGHRGPDRMVVRFTTTYAISANKKIILKQMKNIEHGIVCFCLMVFNATFNNISAISWQSVLLMEETRGPGEVFSQLTLQAAYEWNYGERRFNEGMIKKIRQVGEHRCFLNLLLNFKMEHLTTL